MARFRSPMQHCAASGARQPFIELQRLEAQLADAVASEDFAAAARLRDASQVRCVVLHAGHMHSSDAIPVPPPLIALQEQLSQLSPTQQFCFGQLKILDASSSKEEKAQAIRRLGACVAPLQGPAS
jgi:hypothetical protein